MLIVIVLKCLFKYMHKAVAMRLEILTTACSWYSSGYNCIWWVTAKRAFYSQPYLSGENTKLDQRWVKISGGLEVVRI